MTYRWQWRQYTNGAWTSWGNLTDSTTTNIVGAQTSTLSIPQLSNGVNRNGFQYRCHIVAGSSTFDTEPATLMLNTASNIIVEQPHSIVAPLNENVTFTVRTNDPGATYQWQY